jgi:hypothetical protein
MINGVPLRYVPSFPASKIFGMIGLKGFGPNSYWDDWSKEGRESYEKIVDEYITRYDAWTGHFTRLEESVKREGFRNPLIVTSGPPRMKSQKGIPPELLEKPKEEWILLDGFYGGSRLYVAQKLGMEVPIIVNDWTRAFDESMEIMNLNHLSTFFADTYETAVVHPQHGLVVRNIQSYHMPDTWVDTIMQPARDHLCVEIYNKHYSPKIKFSLKKYEERFQKMFRSV